MPQATQPLSSQSEQKLAMVMKYAPTGLVEIDRHGEIIQLNAKAEILLKPILIATGTSGSNLYPALKHIAPGIVEKIESSLEEAGNIVRDELHSFFLPFGGENLERHFSITITRIFTDCIIIGLDDITEKYQKEQAIFQLVLDRTTAQGKLEITSNILHDIGNAIVGFGSYLSRIGRVLEQDNLDHLQKLAGFFTAQQTSLNVAIGEAKAVAAVIMLNSLTEAQKNNQQEIRNSVKEQLNIISHVQDILNIQRQYFTGNQSQEKKPTRLLTVVNDCMSMLWGSIEKRGIIVSLDIPAGFPVIHGNRTQLMQVILNLLKNSVEAMDINAPVKTISLTATTKANLLILEIQDSGQGFDALTGKQLFARGFTTKASGSGLGLSSCRTIIEGHNGVIEITSEGFGKGALSTIKFKIETPIPVI